MLMYWILLKQDLLKLVGRQEDWVCQHEVIQEYFCGGGEEKEGEHVSISKTWLQKLLDVETAGLLHRTSQAKISLIMRCIHIISLPDLLDRS